jgi:hypothetical protein
MDMRMTGTAGIAVRGGIPMGSPNGNTAQKGLRAWWASPPRTGLRRILSPWEYRHLRFWARVRIGAGTALAGLAVVTVQFGGNDAKTYGWALAFLALAAAQWATATWLLSIDRSLAAGT